MDVVRAVKSALFYTCRKVKGLKGVVVDDEMVRAKKLKNNRKNERSLPGWSERQPRMHAHTRTCFLVSRVPAVHRHLHEHRVEEGATSRYGGQLRHLAIVLLLPPYAHTHAHARNAFALRWLCGVGVSN